MNESIQPDAHMGGVEQAPDPGGREVVVNAQERGVLEMIQMFAGPHGYKSVTLTESQDRKTPSGEGELSPNWHRMIIGGSAEDTAYIEDLLRRTKNFVAQDLTAEQDRRRAVKVANDVASAGADVARTVATAGVAVARRGLAGLAQKVLTATEPKPKE